MGSMIGPIVIGILLLLALLYANGAQALHEISYGRKGVHIVFAIGCIIAIVFILKAVIR